MYTVTEIRNGKVQGSWKAVETIEAAIELAKTCKVALDCGAVYSIENQNGTVVEVIRK